MEDFRSQPFYKKLNKKFSNTVENLINKKDILFRYRVFEWALWIIALCIILKNFNSFNNSNEMINSLIAICTAGILVIIGEKLSEEHKKKFNEAKKKVKDEMLFDICECRQHCTCRNEFRSYMESRKIDLFKNED